jgi:uncharacterized protein (TIGR00369 family)
LSVNPYGVQRLRDLQLFRPQHGMWANLGMRLVEVADGAAAVEGRLTRDMHGRGAGIHRGAVAAIADGALACAAATLVLEGEVATTVELILDYFRAARPGRVVARGRVLHRSGHLVYCSASIEQRGAVLAEATSTIALVRPA